MQSRGVHDALTAACRHLSRADNNQHIPDSSTLMLQAEDHGQLEMEAGQDGEPEGSGDDDAQEAKQQPDEQKQPKQQGGKQEEAPDAELDDGKEAGPREEPADKQGFTQPEVR